MGHRYDARKNCAHWVLLVYSQRALRETFFCTEEKAEAEHKTLSTISCLGSTIKQKSWHPSAMNYRVTSLWNQAAFSSVIAYPDSPIVMAAGAIRHTLTANAACRMLQSPVMFWHESFSVDPRNDTFLILSALILKLESKSISAQVLLYQFILFHLIQLSFKVLQINHRMK